MKSIALGTLFIVVNLLSCGQVNNVSQDEILFEKLVSKGDSCLHLGEKGNAKEYYYQAMILKMDCRTYALLMQKVDVFIDCHSSNKEYNTFLMKGDSCYSVGRFGNAIDYYDKALRIKPNEKYPIRQKELSEDFFNAF